MVSFHWENIRFKNPEGLPPCHPFPTPVILGGPGTHRE